MCPLEIKRSRKSFHVSSLDIKRILKICKMTSTHKTLIQEQEVMLVLSLQLLHNFKMLTYWLKVNLV